MAKKTKKQNKKSQAKALPENMLPQNILPVGERVEADKNIYISQAAYKEIHKFTKNKTTNESGGMLVGTIIEEFGKTNIVISGFIEAKYSDGTPTTLTFTHETWDYVHKEIEKKHKGKKILGWIHTHPDFGIFLSEYDKFIHENFFSEAYQVAYVVDPIQKIEGFYFWINGNLEKCKGFYIYDKTGTQINVDIATEEAEAERPAPRSSIVKDIWIAILSVIVIFLLFSHLSTNKQLKKLEQKQAMLEYQQQNLAYSISDVLTQMQYTIMAQQSEIQQLKSILQGAGIIVEPEQPAGSTDSGAADTGTGDTSQTGQDSATDTSTGDPSGVAPSETTNGVPTDTTGGDTTTNE